MMRSTVLSLPPQLLFSDLCLKCKLGLGRYRNRSVLAHSSIPLQKVWYPVEASLPERIRNKMLMTISEKIVISHIISNAII
jgi:hypothetical protein